MLKMNFNNVNQSQKFRNNLNTFYRSDLKPALRIDNLKFKKLKQPHLVINSIENNFARNLTFKSKLKFLRKRKSIAYQKFLKQLTWDKPSKHILLNKYESKNNIKKWKHSNQYNFLNARNMANTATPTLIDKYLNLYLSDLVIQKLRSTRTQFSFHNLQKKRKIKPFLNHDKQYYRFVTKKSYNYTKTYKSYLNTKLVFPTEWLNQTIFKKKNKSISIHKTRKIFSTTLLMVKKI